ncbi:MAG TPA: peptidylprolyl isomerase, partial [Rhodanobacteraceae bacterium]|nr:peptidylprolyl isomerase [Rhodanobacteraceae bacterium]
DYDFTHMVFAKEADAKKVAAEIAGGKPYDKVFEAHKKEAVQTRTFTHVRGPQLPPALGQAIAGLKAGETTRDPVQSPLGWHVVHLDNVTQHQPPAFEQVKESLRRSLLKQSGDRQMQKLRAEAKVTLADPAPAAATTSAKPAAPPAVKVVPPPPAKPADDATKPKN